MTKTERITALERRIAQLESRIADLEARPRYWTRPWYPRPYDPYPWYGPMYTTSTAALDSALTTSTSDAEAPTWEAQPNLDLSDIVNNLEYKYSDGITS